MPYLLLGIAIASEVVATLALKASDGFSRVGPAVLVVAGYGTAFFLLSLSLRTLPVGFVYAVWSGLGIVLVALAGWALFGERLSAGTALGIALITAGIAVLQVSRA